MPRRFGLSTAAKSVTLLMLLILASCVCGPGSEVPSAEAPRAALLDQLSLTVPNPDFVSGATHYLTEAGYEVDYYSGEEVTVDVYRSLPALGHDLIVVRAHAALAEEPRPEGEGSDLCLGLYTGEAYSEDKYRREQERGLLGIAQDDPDSAARYFAISTRFVEEHMLGTFDDSLLVLMGCDTAQSNRSLQAFFDRGIAGIVGWSGSVSAEHTDRATLHFLQMLTLQGSSPDEALAGTAAALGPDPDSGARLQLYLDR